MRRQIIITVRQNTGRGPVSMRVDWLVDGHIMCTKSRRLRNRNLREIDIVVASDVFEGACEAAVDALAQLALF